MTMACRVCGAPIWMTPAGHMPGLEGTCDSCGHVHLFHDHTTATGVARVAWKMVFDAPETGLFVVHSGCCGK